MVAEANVSAVHSSHSAILTPEIPSVEAERSCDVVMRCHLITWEINSPSINLCSRHYPAVPRLFLWGHQAAPKS